MYSIFFNLFKNQGIDISTSSILSYLCVFVIIFLVTILLSWISSKIIKNLFRQLAKKTSSDFDDALIRHKVPSFLGYLPPLFFLIFQFQDVLLILPKLLSFSINLLEATVALITILIIRGVLKSIKDQLIRYPLLRDKPLESYIQVFMIFIWFIGGIIILSLLTGKEVGVFLTTLGALSAVILLIFKDTILGFVASIQITINDTVRLGDWVTMNDVGADGDVISISLSSVKIQNFDKTITTVPTYKLISDSFTNWRGMSESDGRRIKRSILIKGDSIKFMGKNEINSLREIEILKTFINNREKEINDFNKKNLSNKSQLINGRNFTNLGLFRHYIKNYLYQHPKINKKMTIMCRQLTPTPTGVPLEIYAFIVDKEWVNYEGIVSDIFDHLLASISSFDLKNFEFYSKN
tara:strand:+ start:93 stop:1316 length:1224 start_codon:yes stop_codon:yes gene_type:complete